MLASMSDVEPLNWSDPGVTEFVPTGTVTLLLADVEGSTWLWQTQPEQMTAAVAQLDRSLAGLVTAHHGVRPVLKIRVISRSPDGMKERDGDQDS